MVVAAAGRNRPLQAGKRACRVKFECPHLVVEPRLAEADAWLRRYQRFWSEKLDALESLLLAEDAAKAKKTNKKVKE